MADPDPLGIRTVGDLIARLQTFDADLPIRTADALDGTSDKFELVFSAGLLPPANDAVAIFHIDPVTE